MNKTILLFTAILVYPSFYYGQFHSPEVIIESVPNSDASLFYDIDGDSDQDIIFAATENNKVFAYLNNGLGSFSQRITLFTTDTPMHLYIEDFDGDSHPDIACLSYVENDLRFYKNDGNLGFTFQLAINMSTTAYVSETVLAFSDLNNDGMKDIAYPGGNTIWLKNNGGFNFTSQGLLSGAASTVALGDLNNDGYNDAVSCSFGTVRVNLNDAGTFTSNNTVTYGTPTSSNGIDELELYDYDGDNDTDIFYLNSNLKKIFLFVNNGNGVFGAPTILYTATGNSYPRNLTKKDINADGIHDIIFRVVVNSYQETNTIKMLQGTGTFLLPPVTVYSGIFGQSLIFSDINNNGTNEMMVTSIDVNPSLENLQIYSQTSGVNYTFDFNVDTFYGFSADYLSTFIDLDLDGITDIFAEKNVFKGQANNQFIGAQVPQPVSYNGHMLTDLNGDGYDDMLAVRAGNLYKRMNDGGGNFGSEILCVSSVYANMKDARSVDYNNDGYKDIVYATLSSQIRVMYGNSAGNFTTPSNVTNFYQNQYVNGLSNLAVNYGTVGVGDIRYAVLTGTHAVYASINGIINPVLVYSCNSCSLRDLNLIDFNNDGLNDLAFSDGTVVRWFRNTGNGNFSNEGTILALNGTYAINQWADLDNDGDKDLFSGQSTLFRWVENLSYGNFSPPQVIAQNITLIGSMDVIIRDHDADGDLDIVYLSNSNSYANTFSLLRNTAAQLSQATGRVFIDENQNQLFDSNEYGLPNVYVGTSDGEFADFSNSGGDYNVHTQEGTHTILSNAGSGWTLTTNPVSFDITVTGPQQSTGPLDFGYIPAVFHKDVNAELIGGFPRCNSEVNYSIAIKNTGTLTHSGVVMLTLDSAILFINSDPVPDSSLASAYYWHYDSLGVYDFEDITLTVQMPPFTSMGQDLTSTVAVTIPGGTGADTTITDSLVQVLVCAYDPNDKIADPIGFTPEGYIPMDQEWMEYTVRFQNTGNDTALHVRIIDQISPYLDLTSLELLGYSHAVNVSLEPTRKVAFNFNGINLPDSTVNFNGSQGFCKFRFKILPGLPTGTVINNFASIFFDQNPAVITNTTKTTLYECPPVEFSLPVSPLCFGETLTSGAIWDGALQSTFAWNLNNFEFQTGSSFSWTSDTSGVFTLNVMGTNGICQSDSAISITILPQLTPNVTDTVSVCSGQSTLIFGSPQTQPGIYYNTLQNINGCDSVTGILLQTTTLPVVSFGPASGDTVCIDDGISILPSAIPAGGTYSGAGVTGNQFNPAAAGGGPGIVTYTYANEQQCTGSNFIVMTVVSCLGVGELNSIDFIISPNPFNELVSLSFDKDVNGEYGLSVTDAYGQSIYELPILSGKSHVLIFTGRAAGVYFFRLTNRGTGESVVSKLIHN